MPPDVLFQHLFKSAAELVLKLVSRAYQRQSLIVTTNLMFESWIEVLGCERLSAFTPQATPTRDSREVVWWRELEP